MFSRLLSRINATFVDKPSHKLLNEQEVDAIGFFLQARVSQILGAIEEKGSWEKKEFVHMFTGKGQAMHKIQLSRISDTFPEWLTAKVTSTRKEQYTSTLWKDIESIQHTSVTQLLIRVEQSINELFATLQISDQSEPIGSYRVMSAQQYFYDSNGARENGYDPNDFFVEYFKPNGNYKLVYSSKPPQPTDMTLDIGD